MKTINELPAILLVLAMFAAAEFTGQKEIIFPEIAALALGAWVMEKSPWQSSHFHFWLSPTLAALTGILIVRFFSYMPFFMIIGAFCLVVLQLKLFRSAVLPSISAAILPIITHSDSWYYPLSVCVLTGTIAIGRKVLHRSGCGKDPGFETGTPRQRKAGGEWSLPDLTHWSKLLAGVTLVSAAAIGGSLMFMVAPPLIVAFIELSKPGGALRDKAGKALVLLGSAAFSGVFWLQLTQNVLHWPVWISACIATATVFFLYHALSMPFPPAVAIALLPTILPETSISAYPWHVLAGSAAFVILSKTCLRLSTVEAGRYVEEPAVPQVSPD
ncbi:MAG: hypothetical protein VB050_14215 [Geobacteraceae bacterium]|nr:hypothetical protein [Geobacteraceae bacterium]